MEVRARLCNVFLKIFLNELSLDEPCRRKLASGKVTKSKLKKPVIFL